MASKVITPNTTGRRLLIFSTFSIADSLLRRRGIRKTRPFQKWPVYNPTTEELFAFTHADLRLTPAFHVQKAREAVSAKQQEPNSMLPGEVLYLFAQDPDNCPLPSKRYLMWLNSQTGCGLVGVGS